MDKRYRAIVFTAQAVLKNGLREWVVPWDVFSTLPEDTIVFALKLGATHWRRF